MTQLTLGKIKTADLASWFNVQYTTFRKNPERYYTILLDYCCYEKVYGGIIVSEIFIDTYDKQLNFKDRKLFAEEIELCVKVQDGLSTVSGMSRKFVQQGIYANESTARYRLGKVGKELFGNTLDNNSYGEIGSRELVWAIKLSDYNHYRLLTPEEENRFNEILSAYYSTEVERVKQAALLETALREKTINSDEYFEQKDRLGLNLFRDCIYQFKNETGLTIVHCTHHDLTTGQSFDE